MTTLSETKVLFCHLHGELACLPISAAGTSWVRLLFDPAMHDRCVRGLKARVYMSLISLRRLAFHRRRSGGGGEFTFATLITLR